MKYKYLDHTADLKLQAYGKDLEEAFSNAAIAAFSYLQDPLKVKKKIVKKIEVSANKIESLLYDFLEELLFLLDVDGFLLSEVSDMKIKQKEKWSLSCIVSGDSYRNYNVSGNIKSVTYNDMFVEVGDKVTVQVVLDL